MRITAILVAAFCYQCQSTSSSEILARRSAKGTRPEPPSPVPEPDSAEVTLDVGYSYEFVAYSKDGPTFGPKPFIATYPRDHKGYPQAIVDSAATESLGPYRKVGGTTRETSQNCVKMLMNTGHFPVDAKFKVRYGNGRTLILTSEHRSDQPRCLSKMTYRADGHTWAYGIYVPPSDEFPIYDVPAHLREPPIPASTDGSQFNRDATAEDFVEHMTRLFDFVRDNPINPDPAHLIYYESKIDACLSNTLGYSQRDLQNHFYCLIPVEVRECLGGRIQAYKKKCPRKAPNIPEAINHCLVGEGIHPKFSYFRDNPAALSSFSKAFIVKDGVLDFSIESENEVINNFYVSNKPKFRSLVLRNHPGNPRMLRAQDNFASFRGNEWVANQPRYHELRRKQRRNIRTPPPPVPICSL